MLTADVFPPSTITNGDLCVPSIDPSIPWVPTFSFQPRQNLTLTSHSVPATLNPSTPSVTSTVTSATSCTIPKKHQTSVLKWMALLACELPSAGPAKSPLFKSLPSSLSFTVNNPSITVPSDAFLLPSLHETFKAMLRTRNGAEAGSAMLHRFELSRSSAHPNIVTNYLLHCGPNHGPFSSTPIWDIIVAGSLCAAPLSATPSKGFTPLMTLLLNPAYSAKPKLHPQLPKGGFSSFHEVLRFVNGCKWFIMSVGHLSLYKHSIAFQGLLCLEDAMTTKNLAAR